MGPESIGPSSEGAASVAGAHELPSYAISQWARGQSTE